MLWREQTRWARRVALLLSAVLGVLGCAASDGERIELLSGEAGASAPRCATDGDCAVPLPYCRPGGSVCVACLTDANCGNKICDQATYACADCQSSGDCSGNNPYCSAGDCVECLTEGNCPLEGETCDPVQKKCVTRCAADEECIDGARVLCDEVRAICVECLADGDCAEAKPRCVADKCKECTVDTDCATAEEPFCRLDNNECKECLDDAHCVTGLVCDNYSCKE